MLSCLKIRFLDFTFQLTSDLRIDILLHLLEPCNGAGELVCFSCSTK